MLDIPRQVPAPSAVAWLLRLGDGIPPFVVLRQFESEARACLADHLVQLPAGDEVDRVPGLVAAARVEYTEVLW